MRQRTMRIVLVLAVIAVPLLIYAVPSVASILYITISFLTPLWLPVLLLALAWPLWTRFVRSQFVMSIPYSIIELKPGTETPRAARAMELVFYSLHHRTEISSYASILLGHIRLPWSFEVHAHAGMIRFYLYLPSAHLAAVEARIRAEYRDIEVEQATDYSREYHFDFVRSRLSMCEYSLSKPDPYPLKTYTRHEQEVERRDVFNELLEELVSLSEYEHVFISYLVRPHQRERKTIFDKPTDSLHEDAHHEIAKLIGPKGDLHNASAIVRSTVAGIEAALKKPSFDCGVRALYMADRTHFKEERSRSLEHIFDRFEGSETNSLRPYEPRERVGWPLTEIFAVSHELAMHYYLQLYRRRVFFSPPYYGRAFVLNTEELATVYHIPHIARISSLAKMRGFQLEAPDNLPI